MVQEDATTILSYASPYNVQLELLDGKGTLPYVPSPHSLNGNGQPSLTHPLYRSSSQEDFNTIERNARKKLFPNDDGNYPTLKMDQTKQSSIKNLPFIHKENEKRNSKQLKEVLVENEKLQNKSDTIVVDEIKQMDDGKKGLKFGIRVLPPNVNDKIAATPNTKSPNKVQADNENNTNKEIDVKRGSPPPVSKRTKNKIDDIKPITNEIIEVIPNVEFERQGSFTSSGIRRDASGIPQEIPNQMMQAALAAQENRKSTNLSAVLDNKKNKGKAPRPPQSYMDDSTDTMDTTLDITDLSERNASPIAQQRINSKKMNFSDNFITHDSAYNSVFENGFDDSTLSSANGKHIHGSDTESQLAANDHGNLNILINKINK